MVATEREVRRLLEIFLGARGLEIPEGLVWSAESTEEEYIAEVTLKLRVKWDKIGKCKGCEVGGL